MTEPMNPMRAMDLIEDRVPATTQEKIDAWQWIHDNRMTSILPGWYEKRMRELLDLRVINDAPERNT